MPGEEPTPSGFEQRLLARARAAGFRRGERIIVGFSGGRDSLALAAALRRVQAVLGLEPVLVHVDHRLRDDSAAATAQAAALANALPLPFRLHRLDAHPRDVHLGVGIEEAARRERYRALFAIAREEGAGAVATGHHLHDQAETVLLHLLRGGGVHGAAAMAERTPPPVPLPHAPEHDISPKGEDEPWLWRPLLGEPRAAIDGFLRAVALTPLEDPSNDDLGLRRNALRHDVLPRMEKHFPGAAAALARFAALAAADDALLEAMAESARAAAMNADGALDAARLLAEPPALRRRVVRRWLEGMAGSPPLTADRTDAVVALAEAGRGGRGVELGEGWTVRLRAGMLRVDNGRVAGSGERVHERRAAGRGRGAGADR